MSFVITPADVGMALLLAFVLAGYALLTVLARRKR